jgi:hypothetical protein
LPRGRSRSAVRSWRRCCARWKQSDTAQRGTSEVGADRVTTTGQAAWCSRAWLTEPSSMPRRPPRPREPTTTSPPPRAAPAPTPARACARAGPVSQAVAVSLDETLRTPRAPFSSSGAPAGCTLPGRTGSPASARRARQGARGGRRAGPAHRRDRCSGDGVATQPRGPGVRNQDPFRTNHVTRTDTAGTNSSRPKIAIPIVQGVTGLINIAAAAKVPTRRTAAVSLGHALTRTRLALRLSSLPLCGPGFTARECLQGFPGRPVRPSPFGWCARNRCSEFAVTTGGGFGSQPSAGSVRRPRRPLRPRRRRLAALSCRPTAPRLAGPTIW